MDAPITYVPNFVSNPEAAFQALRDELEWERRSDAPRCEYYCNDYPNSYIYGFGRGRREYHPRPYHPVILDIRKDIEARTGTTFEVCFLNRYLDSRDQLGWHADDSPEMDDARPIAIVSLGVERDIMFQKYLGIFCGLCGEKMPNHKTPDCRGPDLAEKKTLRLYSTPERLRLGHGSLCLMAPGMQDEWQHRIPKAAFECGERISLTFRGYVSV